MTRETNHKLRAVFLAAIMFLWLFAGTVALAGSATAQFNEEGEDVGADRAWDSGTTGWQGQQLYFQADPGNSGDVLYRVREHDGGADYGSTVATFELGPGNSAVIDSSNFEGQYVITRDGEVVITDEQGTETSTTTDPATADANDIDFAVQNLDTSFSSDQAALDENATLRIGSNRAEFDVEVRSDNLSQSELQSAFQFADNVSTTGDAIVLEDVRRGSVFDVHFSNADFDAGDDVSFDFDVADTTASDSATISIAEDVEDVASFNKTQYSQERGDIATFQIDTQGLAGETVTVVVGNQENVGYEATVEVTPGDDGQATIHMNTWLASRTNGTTAASASSSSDVFSGDVASVNESTTSRDRVLDAGLYDLAVSVDGEEQDVAVLDLTEPSLDELTVHTHPNQGFNSVRDDRDQLYQAREDGRVTESDQIAVDDGIVVAIEVSGVHGLLEGVENPSEVAGLLNITAEQQNPGPNEDPTIIDDPDQFDLLTDQEEDAVFLLINSNEIDAQSGDEFEVTFEATPEFLNQFLRSRNAVDEGEDVSDNFTIVDRQAEFDTTEVEGEDVVLVPPEENATISGATTVAPGTMLQIRTRATGESPFLMTERATVNESGAFSAEFDFSGVSEGQRFDATIRRQGFENDARTQGVVGTVDETPTPTPEDDEGTPTPTPEDDEETPSPTEPEDDDTPTPEDTDDQPGFGAIIALVALLAAALLAARRRSLN